mgnify:CR=1 FL=1
MKKILLSLFVSAGLVACGGGGGDSSDVFSDYSRTYDCYTAYGTFAGQYGVAFSASSATLTTGGVQVSAAAAGKTDKGGYKYASMVPSGRLLAVILEPSAPPYVVAFAFSKLGSTDVDQSTMRVCR